MATDKNDSGPDFRKQLDNLRTTKTALDEVDTQLSATVGRLEKALGSLRLGVPVSFHISGGDDEDRVHRFLAFKKYGTGKTAAWRLVIQEGVIAEPDDWTERPLSDMPREERAEILRFRVPELVRLANEQLAKKIAGRRQTIEQTDALIDAIERWHTTSSWGEDASDDFANDPDLGA